MSMGMTAFAADPITSIDLVKDVTADGNTYAPNTEFKFTVDEGAGGTFIAGSNGSTATALPGEEGGLGFKEGFTGIKFDPTVDGIISDEGLSHTGTGALVIDSSVFDSTGIYHYTVDETLETYDGITYDDKTMNVYLYVYSDDSGDYYVGNVVINREDEESKSDELKFINKYGTDENGDTVHDITIRKEVTGSLGEKMKDFTFSIQIDGENGEKYKAVKTDKETEEETITLTSGEPATVTLQDAETIQIFGISENDSYKVEETGKNDGYTVYYTIGNARPIEGDLITNGKVDHDGLEIVFTNHKDAVTPTGIVMTFAPYIALIALAGVFAVTFLRKRREEF